MKICIALTKGRLENQFLDYFQSLSYNLEPLIHKGRKLSIETEQFHFIFAKGVDVATYVEHGIADLGVVGEDILLEYQPDVYNLLALPFGKCQFALAERKEHPPTVSKRTIATKYPFVATEYFRKKGESVDIVKLEGSVELAPILGLADAIIDIVETGTTLKANGLIVKETIHSISARCIANRSSLKIKREKLAPIIELLESKEFIK
ncbi:ATP phosphoribosyltransferase [Heyndrickxia sporothermodurans]|uniref:ATP phosphoribosyltransferase n=1 Tax=Heyndrickxia sporothermodurans TaxID=46224 RepID=A0A150L811_9BACI|nr:ATP phosphoribosyltransferase [Heyndrickxia sporothermodurans]KYD08471.1 ATP phosphoribosyltransferase [Heyndrickxia sporothermodurans]MBL5767394.1 ATP phosphoribosyltransferase [Heyndrickxia sporothermodurans]MBL5770744.1 ATP phosphoribosyltransferase [Heyndrickxia sporothermodurans]MBL5774507.1 ATP phosphoribosyltransferase [Heyndrickxia sporothermodurans]MBL5777867.1 ATP phosphoribosyltransferase [Heyndrickxia sporothermodurans]